jgi:hypothetical protein
LPLAALAAVVVTGAAVGVGVAMSTPEKSGSRPASHPLATPLTAVDTTTLAVRRASFCAAVPSSAAAAALGAAVHATSSYKPGPDVAVTATVRDVADEYGCSWTDAAGRTARAWVFAPPITRARAKSFVAAKPAGCHSVTAPAYGAPSSALRCGDSTLLRGLFGDAWLSCELPSHEVAQVGRWCLEVARAAG